MKCLSLVLTVLLLSCSSQKKSREQEAEELISIYEPKWFSVSEKHSLRDREGRIQPHLFFDLSPEFAEKEQLANIVVTTAENSHLAYNVDLISGQRYYAHSYCNQSDVWNQKSGTFGRPYFSIAYMPRVLDQMGEPQKVIVFALSEPDFSNLEFNTVMSVINYSPLTSSQLSPRGRNRF